MTQQLKLSKITKMDINYSYTHRGYTNGQKHEKLHNRKNNLSLGPKQTPYLLRSMYNPATEITKKKSELLTPPS
jgi:hypothetical protein